MYVRLFRATAQCIKAIPMGRLSFIMERTTTPRTGMLHPAAGKLQIERVRRPQFMQAGLTRSLLERSLLQNVAVILQGSITIPEQP
jgi:hypothetical protein